jgi:hypothetical protein
MSSGPRDAIVTVISAQAVAFTEPSNVDPLMPVAPVRAYGGRCRQAVPRQTIGGLGQAKESGRAAPYLARDASSP